MFTRTKIICTMGPAVSSYEKILALLHAGMNIARLNFSHGTHEEHAQTIALLKKARKETKKPLALLLDMQGPKIRVGQIKGGALSLMAGQTICLVEEGDGSVNAIPFHPFEVIRALSPGMTILFDDGYISGKILTVTEKRIEVELGNPGVLKSGKGLNIPGESLPLPAMTEEDFLDLQFGCDHDVDFIAASFIRSAEHVMFIKKALAKAGGQHIPIIAKIENMEGVHNFDSILQVVDGILVARGDLGVEVDLATIPRLQKMMIRKCIAHATFVITATHMLESMISNPRPTRAEVSDVANAVYDFSSAVMLSAETAIGKYPIEAVQIMQRIAQETERDIQYAECLRLPHVSSDFALQAVKAAYESKGKAIFLLDGDASVARAISALRPGMPIFVLTAQEKQYHQFGMYWAVSPILTSAHGPEAFAEACRFAQELQIVSKGDPVISISENSFQKMKVL